jgi:peptidoglycan/xylan/chitin deacetylase (PgdA/CDA1 family)
MTTPVTWPDRARCAIMMTFDLDGESPWIHRDPALAERPLHMSMGAYGPRTGMPRILDLLDRYGIKTCFFIPGWIIERYPALCEDIVRRGHEAPVGNGIWSQEDVWEIWSEEFEGMYAEGGFFNWLGHPQVVGRPSRMRMVERLIGRNDS